MKKIEAIIKPFKLDEVKDTIAHAVYSGHECARDIDAGGVIEPFAVERPSLSSQA